MSKQAPTPYPKLPEGEHPHFWLIAYFRDAAQLQQIRLARQGACSANDASVHGSLAHIRADALVWAERLINIEAEKSAEYVIEEGLLPFAWHGTKVLEGAAA